MKTISYLTALAASVAILPAYELHEWGTFTTVAGSDGVLLTGLEREEEALPAYVRHHPGFMNHHPAFAGNRMMYAKRIPVPARNVKVKMETPVIYFHSEEAFQAKVKVGFEGGTISQWFPERSGGETIKRRNPQSATGPQYLDFSKPYTGSIEWEVDVLSREESQDSILFKPGDLLQWTRARIPEANTVRDANGATEGFLFYRGLGTFDPGLQTRVSQDETLELTNNTGGEIPYLLVYERMPDGTHHWTEHHALADNASISFRESEISKKGNGTFNKELYKSLSDNLAKQGLLESEARAMVETWWQSYFAAPGLRVFWVLPDDRTNAILPLEVSPAPEEIVRVIVGRSEVLRPRQENQWLTLATSKEEKDTQTWQALTYSDRFGLSYGERIRTLQQQAKR